LGLFFIYMASFYKRFYYPNYFIYLLFVFLGGLVRAFLGPTIFFQALLFLKNISKCCHLE
jgi:hypothetical protein